MAVFPASAAGAWTGTIKQSDGRSWRLELSAPAGAHVGSVRYPELGCAGTLTLISVTVNTMRALEQITSGSCTPSGSVNLTPRADGGMDWSYLPDGDVYTATGVLTRGTPTP